MSKILVVDDSRLHRAVIAAALGDAGHITIEAASGLEGLAKVQMESPDLMVLDWIMPGMDGAGVCERLRADPFLQHIPVLMLTVRDSRTDRIKGLKLGADAYLAKPFDPEELIAEVEALLRRAYDRNPLTKLPASPLIQRHVEGRLRAGDTLAICYIDIDGFKAYNDYYGYPKGDEVIVFLASIIRRAIATVEGPRFVGHIGGDDFVVVMDPAGVDTLCQQVIAEFDAGASQFYAPEDLERGYIEQENRQGEMHRYPPMSLSIPVVTNELRHFLGYAQVGQALAELKSFVKRQPGSNWVRDRRR